MAESSAGERTEEPTARRLSEARRDGNVARSQDLTGAVVLAAGLVFLALFGEQLFKALSHNTHAMLRQDFGQNATRPDDLGPLAGEAIKTFASALLPLMIGVVFFTILVNLLQIGPMLTGRPLKPSPSKLNPINGVKNMFNLKALMRLGMSILKLIIVATVATAVIHQDLPRLMQTGHMQVLPAAMVLMEMIFWLAVKLVVLLLVLALLDFWYQKWQRHQDLKMTRQQVQDESKNMEGNPKIKQRRAQIARQLAMQRIAAAVPQADVVVTNPTHFSVAIKYDPNTMPAPKVVAKGADHLAFQIRRIAMTNGVPIVEKKPLARALYHHVEVGQHIPPEHYAAAAEILAYVYRLSEEASMVTRQPAGRSTSIDTGQGAGNQQIKRPAGQVTA